MGALQLRDGCDSAMTIQILARPFQFKRAMLGLRAAAAGDAWSVRRCGGRGALQSLP